MRSRRRGRGRGRAGVLAAAVVVMVVLGAVPAGAETSAGKSGVIECEGTVTGTIVGDVVVRGPGQCVLERAVVTGDVVVIGRDDFAGGVVFRRSAARGDLVLRGDGASADLHSSTVKGDIRTEGEVVSVYLSRSSVYGGVLMDSPFGNLLMVDSTVRRSVRGAVSYAQLIRVRVEGAITLLGDHSSNFDDGDRLWLELSEVSGWVTTRELNTHVHGSTLHKGLTLLRGAIADVCGSSVAADLTVRGMTPGSWRGGGSYGSSRLGAASAQRCASMLAGGGVPPDVVVGGATLIVNNAVPVQVGRLTTGSLDCRGNTKSLVVGPDVVATERLGQCAS